MNFYLFENDSRHTTAIRDLIEADFNNKPRGNRSFPCASLRRLVAIARRYHDY